LWVAWYPRVVRWADVKTQQPRLAALGREKLGDAGVVLVGTIRKDGSPRISAVEPFFWRGDLWLPMLLDSLKAKDLLRDPRVLIHNIVTSRDGTSDGEFMLRGHAVSEDDRRVNEEIAAAIASQLPWQPEPGRFDLFRIEIDQVASIRWGDHNDQYLTRWPPGHEQVRRGTSATSVGDPEPWSELLD
jgi:Pyridoxamine 5'-phosphate oxidase